VRADSAVKNDRRKERERAMVRLVGKLGAVALVAFQLVVPTASAVPKPAGGHPPASKDDRLQQYTVSGTPVEIDRLARGGHEVTARRTGAARQREVDLVLTGRQRAALERRGLTVALTRNNRGETALQAAARQAEGGYRVWRPYAGPGGIEEELRRVAVEHPGIVELVELGRSARGQPILGLRVSRRESGLGAAPVAERPAVLFCSVQHAREWIAGEVNRRLLHHFVDRYGTDPAVTRLVDTYQLWFVVVANPDGYDHTFTEGNRLWRKNLRDNDGDGRITVFDGVDPNRNFPTRWNYDDEGSSSSRSDETYRGPAPASEPETTALDGLLGRVHFAFLVNYHSFGRLLLYPSNWQVETETADQPIYEALSGTDARPAVKGYDPDLGAELYITNGETTDHALTKYGTLAWTVELGEGCEGCGFVFPDDEGLVQAEFKRNLPFALDVAASAGDPAEPVSHLGTTAPDFKVDTFPLSYGDPQPVQVDAKRKLGPVTMSFQINDGSPVAAPTAEWQGGERYGDDGDVYYHRLRGTVTGAHPGDRVKVHFEAGGDRSESFSYRVASDTGHAVLIMAAEDYTDPTAGSGERRPRYLAYYTDALKAAGIEADVYDVDAHDRRPPDPLGVLGHYQAVVWYTGDDRITRDGNENEKYGVSKLALDEVLAVRDYLNEGGRLLYTGKHAGLQESSGLFYGTNGHPEAACRSDHPDVDCLPLGDDFHQYWLGVGVRLPLTGLDPDGNPSDVAGLGPRLGDLRFGLSGGDGADNQKQATAALVPTSQLLPPERYPQFESRVEAVYETGRPQPFGPFTGQWFVTSQAADASYKRLRRVVDLSGAGTGELSFRTSYDTDENWDFLFVEAHTVGGDDWTTLPDSNGHSSSETGPDCAESATVHPFLAHYQTPIKDKPCAPKGSTGAWYAATGRSDGWEEWRMDLSPWAGRAVEVSITYASDSGYQGLGVFIDDAAVKVGAQTAATSFEDGLGGWSVPGPAEGTVANENDWVRSDAGLQAGAIISTPSTLYLGFGFEAIPTALERAAVMGRAMAFLRRSS
jgi:murein tripeptide amidase MpaA